MMEFQRSAPAWSIPLWRIVLKCHYTWVYMLHARIVKIDMANAYRNVPVQSQTAIYLAWYGMKMSILISKFHEVLGQLQFCLMQIQMH